VEWEWTTRFLNQHCAPATDPEIKSRCSEASECVHSGLERLKRRRKIVYAPDFNLRDVDAERASAGFNLMHCGNGCPFDGLVGNRGAVKRASQLSLTLITSLALVLCRLQERP
jgi:hypothetical protein